MSTLPITAVGALFPALADGTVPPGRAGRIPIAATCSRRALPTQLTSVAGFP